MSTVIPLRDLRNHHAQIMERVASGESFVVTRDGVPVADVTPHDKQGGPPTFPRVAALAGYLSPTAVDARAWLADIRASEGSVDDTLDDDPWKRASERARG